MRRGRVVAAEWAKGDNGGQRGAFLVLRLELIKERPYRVYLFRKSIFNVIIHSMMEN